MSGEHQHTNRLIRETSPYLLQHAHNPVDWYPWGEEALARAREDEKPVLLSIGYSACHWCHVMERESFENDSIARLMNKHFVWGCAEREGDRARSPCGLRPLRSHRYRRATLRVAGCGWDHSPLALGRQRFSTIRLERLSIPEICRR